MVIAYCAFYRCFSNWWTLHCLKILTLSHLSRVRGWRTKAVLQVPHAWGWISMDTLESRLGQRRILDKIYYKEHFKLGIIYDVPNNTWAHGKRVVYFPHKIIYQYVLRSFQFHLSRIHRMIDVFSRLNQQLLHFSMVKRLIDGHEIPILMTCLDCHILRLDHIITRPCLLIEWIWLT